MRVFVYTCIMFSMSKVCRKAILLAIISMVFALPTAALAEEETPTPSASVAPSEEIFTPKPEPDILESGSRGETVARIQRRLKDLGYYQYKPTGYFISVTQSALQMFQEVNGLEADGSVGDITLDKLFSMYPERRNTSGIPGYTAPTSVAPTASDYGEKVKWDSIDQLIRTQERFVVEDLYSNLSCTLVRTGGSSNMQAEPATAQDAATLKSMFNGVVSGEKRAVVVVYGGGRYAASLYGALHGTDTVSENEAQGHVNLYFSGSVSEATRMTDLEHEQNISLAANENTDNN